MQLYKFLLPVLTLATTFSFVEATPTSSWVSKCFGGLCHGSSVTEPEPEDPPSRSDYHSSKIQKPLPEIHKHGILEQLRKEAGEDTHAFQTTRTPAPSMGQKSDSTAGVAYAG
jgi:hypothetical protein